MAKEPKPSGKVVAKNFHPRQTRACIERGVFDATITEGITGLNKRFPDAAPVYTTVGGEEVTLSRLAHEIAGRTEAGRKELDFLDGLSYAYRDRGPKGMTKVVRAQPRALSKAAPSPVRTA